MNDNSNSPRAEIDETRQLQSPGVAARDAGSPGDRAIGQPSNLPARRSTPDHPAEGAAGRQAGGDIGAPGVATAISGPLAQMHRLIERAGEEPFPPEIQEVLCEPIDDKIVSIRPDGLIYVSHPHYRDRLDRAFGVGGWALVPLAVPTIKGNRMCWYGFLKARGQYIADAVGGSSYWASNQNQSYDDAAESAKSDCLVRCCKALPMFRECWDKEFGEAWKAAHTEQGVTSTSQGKKVWKKKGEAMRNFDVRPGRVSQGEYHRPERIQEAQTAHMEAIANEGTLRTLAREPDAGIEDDDSDWAQEGE